MQQAVQQDISSMLSQPAGFVAEASSALANGAAQEPSQQRLANAAEQAINSVITNATQDIINNRPLNTTTAHAIIATKKILNTVVTQSAQLMNSAMEGIVEQVTNKSSPANLPMPPQRQNVNPTGLGNCNVPTPELTSISDHDLMTYINPQCYDPQANFLM